MTVDAPLPFPVDDLGEVPLLQRAEELDFLEKALQRSCDDGLQLAVLAGPEGIGKTAVLNAFARKDEKSEAGPSLLTIESSATPREPFAAILSLLAKIHRQRGRIGKATPSGQGGGLDLDMLEFTIGQLPEDGSEDLFAQIATSQSVLFAGLAEIVIAHAQQRPLAILLEDIQEIGSRSAEFLDLFLRHPESQKSPILFVAAYRGDDRVGENEFQKILPILRPRPSFQECEVKPFTPAVLDTWFRHRIGPIVGGLSIIRKIHAATEGNPRRVEELVDSLVARETIVRHGEAWQIETGPEGFHLMPEATEKRLLEGISRLGKNHVEVLRWCAVLGRPSSSSLIEGLSKIPPNRIGYLWTDLERDQYIRREEGESDPLLSLTSSKVRTRLYEEISEKDRARRHLAVGRALESVESDRLAEVAPELAKQFARAGQARREKTYALLAGRTLRQRGDRDGSRRTLQRALELIGPKGKRHERREAFLELGRTAIESGRFEEARSAFERARRESKESETAECLEGISRSYLSGRRMEKALQTLESGATGGNRPSTPELNLVRAEIEIERGRFRPALEALDGLEPDSLETPALLLVIRAAARDRLGEIGPALADLDAAAHLPDRSAGVAATARGQIERLRIYLETGRVNEAEALLPATRDAIASVEDDHLAWRSSILTGRTALLRGDLASALRQFKEARKHAAKHLSERDRFIAEIELAVLLTAGRQEKKALDCAVKAVKGFESIGEEWGLALARRALALVSAARGEVGPAQKILVDAIETFHRIGAVAEAARTRLELTRLLARRKRHDETESIVAEILETASQIEDPGLAAMALQEEGRRLLSTGALLGARQALEESLEELKRLGLHQAIRRGKKLRRKMRESRSA